MKRINFLLLFLFIGLLSVTSCRKETTHYITPTTEDSSVIYSLNYMDFESPTDVVMQTSSYSVSAEISKSLLAKLNFELNRGNVLTLWPDIKVLPEYMRIDNIKDKGDAYVVSGNKVDVSEVLGDVNLTLDTKPYVDPNASMTKSTLANGVMVDSRFLSKSGTLHPSVLYVNPDHLSLNDLGFESNTQANDFIFIHDDIAIVDFREQAQVNSSIKIGISFKGHHEFKLTPDKDDKDNYFKTELEYSAEAYAKMDLNVSGFKLKKFGTTFHGEYLFAPTFSVEGKAKKTFGDKDYVTIIKFGTYSATFFIGPVPVVVTVEPSLDRKLNIELSAQMSLNLPFKFTGSYTVGAIYENKNWTHIEEKQHKEEWPTDLTGAGLTMAVTAEANAGIYLRAAAKLYGVAGPNATIGPNINIAAQAKLTNLHKLDASLKGKLDFEAAIGAEFKVLKWSIASWEHKWSLYSLEMFDFSWSKDFTQPSGPKPSSEIDLPAPMLAPAS